jgi:hypothetical protein
MTATNKRLLISESHDDSNRCTPYRGKPDQHIAYASHASPRMPGVRFLRAVPVHDNFSRVVDRVEQGHCSREKKAPDTINSAPADRSVGPYPVSLLSQPIKQWGQSQASTDDRLLGLLDPYHQHTTGTFNTCSRGPIERSLTDTDGGYNLGGVVLPHIYPPTFPTSYLRFP